MTIQTLKRYSLLFFILFLLPLSTIQCTSSDEDTTVLDEELGAMGDDSGDGMVDDIEDLEDVAEEDLQDIVDGDDAEFADGGDEFDEGLEEEDSDNALADSEEDFGDDDFGDEADEFDESEDEFADIDEEDDAFDEFDDLEEGGEEKKDFAQNEEALADELNQKDQGYPVADNPTPQFPDEVMGSEAIPPQAGQPPVPPPGQVGQPLPPIPGAVITSETTEVIDLPDPIEPTTPQDDLGMADPIVPPSDDQMEEVSSLVPVQKIKEDPFYRNERLLNSVYIARPDDSLQTISEKIYGEDRSKQLLADNSYLARGVDPGDKIYYNSPNRPDDRKTLKVYYEDIGLPAQSYTTKKDDNIRRLGSKFLGFADGWKEIWAINPDIVSKSILPSRTRLRFWTGNETNPDMELAGGGSSADDGTDPMDDEMGMDDEEDAMYEDDPMAAGTLEDSELPMEPALPEAQIATDPTLEPEPVADIEPFPEEGVEETPGPQPAAMRAPEQQSDSLLSIGAIALLVMAGAGLVAIQIKKRKDATGMNPGSLEYTQV